MAFTAVARHKQGLSYNLASFRGSQSGKLFSTTADTFDTAVDGFFVGIFGEELGIDQTLIQLGMFLMTQK